MNWHSLFKNVEIRRLSVDGTNQILAAGTTDVDSEIVDTFGYEGVAFVTALGVLAASSAVTVKHQQNDVNSATGMADLAGSSHGPVAATDDNKFILSEIFHPQERYVRQVTTRGDGGNSTIDALFVLLFRPINAAVTQGATVFGHEVLNSPGEGTA